MGCNAEMMDKHWLNQGFYLTLNIKLTQAKYIALPPSLLSGLKKYACTDDTDICKKNLVKKCH